MVPVRNFNGTDYPGGPQNWDFAQDSLGRIYVANSYGTLIYDGQRWNLIPIGNSTPVRSLHFDGKTDRVYAGGSGEFGYYTPTGSRKLLGYVSLIPKLPSNFGNFSEIWNIYPMHGKIWFQGDNCMFGFDGQRVDAYRLEGRISCSNAIGGLAFIAKDDGSILRFDGTSFVRLLHTEELQGKKVRGLLPFGDTHLLIVTADDALFTYGNDGLRPLESDISAFLKEYQAFSCTKHGLDYVFGTVGRGAVVKNFVTGTTRYINKESSVQNNTVLSCAFDRAGNLWLGLDNGLDYAVYNTNYSSFLGNSSDIGAGYSSIVKGNLLYLGTSQGLFTTTYPQPETPDGPPVHNELRGQVWQIMDVGDELVVAGDAGIFYGKAGAFRKIEGIQGALSVHRLKESPAQAIVSAYGGFHVIERTPAGWIDRGPVKGYDDIGGSLYIDNRGYIWLSHWRKGVYRLHYDPETHTFDRVRLFNSKSGLATDYTNAINIFDGEPLVLSEGKVYRFNYDKDKFEPYEALNKHLTISGASSLHTTPDKRIALIGGNTFEMFRKTPDGGIRKELEPFSVETGKMIPGYEDLYFVGGNRALLSNQNGFWLIDPYKPRVKAEKPKLFVNSVYANMDSLVYMASPDGVASSELTVPHTLNSLRLELAYPDFSAPRVVEFCSWLEGYEDGYSQFSKDYMREYTQLPAGKYKFHFRARDTMTGTLSESVFNITVLPPWYQSVVAIIFYCILGALLIWVVANMINNRMARSRLAIEVRNEKEMEEVKRHAEKEALMKDYEIATLKSEQLELDVQNKSHELSNTAMNLVRKNEILQQISEMIAEIQKIKELDSASPGVQRKLSRIQSSIKENISHDNDWKLFTQNFDRVYENFTRRLIEEHPNLTAADRRLCCYIKMELSSKDIAPLLNISYKSVEMARYRLRKKMNLPPDVSLGSYLAGFG